MESSYDEAEKEIVNLSQLCFYYSNLIFPRVVQSVPEIEQFIETIGEASDREKGLLKVMLNMHNSTGMQNESYKMYLLNKKLLEYEEELERKNSDYFSEEKFLRLQEKADKLQEEQKILSKNLYKEENIRKSKEELYQQALAEKDMLIRELADLREMVFSFNNQVEEEETATNCGFLLS